MRSLPARLFWVQCMILNKIDDPRDALAKASRRELVEFAHAHGQTDINENMAADDGPNGVPPGIRTILRQRGLTAIRPSRGRLGKEGRHETKPILTKKAAPPAPAAVPTSEWDEFQRWKASQQPKPAPERKGRVRLVERPKSEINKLRDQCKALGIRMGRRDNKDALRAKIEAHSTQNGKDASQLG